MKLVRKESCGSKLLAMASNLLAMASNLEAMASNLIASGSSKKDQEGRLALRFGCGAVAAATFVANAGRRIQSCFDVQILWGRSQILITD